MSAKKTQMIPPDAYPQMMSKAQAQLMSRTLHSAVTVAKAKAVIEDAGEDLRAAVRADVAALEAAGRDQAVLSDKATEIKGMAETAGMISTGRIAAGLCRYFEEAERAGKPCDPAVVALHVSAIARAAHDSDAMSHTSDAVAKELAALVTYKLRGSGP